VILTFAGGVGGAKLAHGLSLCLAPAELMIAVNTGDDFEHLGLHVSPDIDTVMYTLGGCADRERGWGRSGETWNFMEALERLGGETWFKLGDRDIATHVERTRRLRNGEMLSAVTADFAEKLGVRHAIAPMSDAPVRTRVHTDEGDLDFQDYFVRRACKPRVRAVEYFGARDAAPAGPLNRAMSSPDLRGIVICPSNPLLSIAPILAVAGLRDWLSRRKVPAIAVSPLINGAAIKGPAAKILRETGMGANCSSIAQFYCGLIDGLIVDPGDVAGTRPPEGMQILSADILMRDDADRKRLAQVALDFISRLKSRR